LKARMERMTEHTMRYRASTAYTQSVTR
jgi:hypothetical protein